MTIKEPEGLPENPHAAHVETAFLSLSFALKLWHYAREGRIPLEEFDIALVVEDPGVRICLPEKQFNTPEDLILATENNISVAFGVAAKTLWEAVNEMTAYGRTNPMATDADKVAGLCYMIRCCFAHGTAAPRWKIDNQKFRTTYSLGNRVIDLRTVSGRVFGYASIGGADSLWLLRSELESRKLI